MINLNTNRDAKFHRSAQALAKNVEIRAGRIMGHINLHLDDLGDLSAQLDELQSLVDELRLSVRDQLLIESTESTSDA